MMCEDLCRTEDLWSLTGKLVARIEPRQRMANQCTPRPLFRKVSPSLAATAHRSRTTGPTRATPAPPLFRCLQVPAESSVAGGPVVIVAVILQTIVQEAVGQVIVQMIVEVVLQVIVRMILQRVLIVAAHR